MLIDAHQHFWSIARDDYDWLTPDQGEIYRDFRPDQLRPLMADAGIAATIVVQAAPTEAETLHLLDLAESHGWIRGVVGWTNLAAIDASTRIGALASHPKLVGFRPMLQDMDERDWILRAELRPALEALIERDLVLDVLIRPDQVRSIAQLAERFPQLAIVIDHAAKPRIGEDIDHWAAAMQWASLHANVRVKLSGLLTEAPVGVGVDDLREVFGVLLDAFGPRRMIWGSDWPVLTLAADYARWVEITYDLLAGLSAHERLAILGGNASEIYGLFND